MSRRWLKMARFLLLIALPYGATTVARDITTLTNNDPYPPYTTLESSYLQDIEKVRLRDSDFFEEKCNTFSISVAAFGQHADRGRSVAGNKLFPQTVTTTCPTETTPTNSCCNITATCGTPVELGDLTGRTSMIALLLGNIPADKDLGATLEAARTELKTYASDLSRLIDPTERLGYFSHALKYHKHGIRLDFSLHLFAGVGINVRTSFSSIFQTLTCRKDLTCKAVNECTNESTGSTSCPQNVKFVDDSQFAALQNSIEQFLMRELKQISGDLTLNLCNFQERSVDEVRFALFWRHGFELNRTREDFPHVLFTPFVQLTGSISPGKKRDSSHIFSVPFGNNTHSAIAFNGGIDFNFVETIEIGGEIGYVHFFDKNFCQYRVPTHECQRVFYPFTTDVNIAPGQSSHFVAKIAAYHFLDKLSMFFRFIIVDHKPDKITLRGAASCPGSCSTTTSTNDTSVFKPQVLENRSGWKSKMANVGFNYDLSPNLGIGFLWQAPLSQRNAYRSSTVMLGLYGTF